MKKIIVLSLTLLILLVLMPSSFAINSEAHAFELDNADDDVALTNPYDNTLTLTDSNENNILNSNSNQNNILNSSDNENNILNSSDNENVASGNSENITDPSIHRTTA